jgi:hypothetical protein
MPPVTSGPAWIPVSCPGDAKRCAPATKTTAPTPTKDAQAEHDERGSDDVQRALLRLAALTGRRVGSGVTQAPQQR